MKSDIHSAIKSCEERIRLYEKSISKKNYKGRNRLRYSVHLENVKIAALRAQEEAEKNEPLTLDELRQMDGEKIYIRYVNHCKTFYNDEIAPYYGKNEQYIQHYDGMLRACDLPLKYYGEEWLAYRRRPKEGSENG